MKPRIAILTSLIDFSPAYSLSGIILDQAQMLIKNGYQCDLLCLKNFKKRGQDPDIGPERAEKMKLRVKYVLPQTRLHDYQPTEKPKEDFEAQVKAHYEGYKEVLEPYDVVISHDIMFLSWHLPQNKALRQCIDLWPEKNWLHWVHSGPSVPPEGVCYPSTLRYSAAPHSHYVYLNESQKLDYSLMINAPKSQIFTVYNPKDLRDVWGFSDLACDIIKRYDLFDHDILEVYPFSTPRWTDKGVKQLLRIFSFWKKQRVRARLVLVNAHCNSQQDQAKIDAIEAYAKLCGLIVGDDVILTSQYSDEIGNKDLRYNVPFRTVRELFLLSNLFIFPSKSECCSLIQAEAAITGGKFFVLNKDFQPMLEFCASNVMSYEFTRNDPDTNQIYYECVAREIWANLRQEATIMNTTLARKRFYNRDWIFRTQFEPLLYLGFSERKHKAAEKPAEVIRPEFASLRLGDETKIPIEVPFENEVIEPDYSNPKDGMKCDIFGECDKEHREDFCFKKVGHCLMLDERKK